jgi:hypothetical protein
VARGTATAEVVELPAGATFTRRMVPVEALQMDPRYQRKLDMPRVEKMAREWDPRLADEIKVSERENGSLWLIDGQHRRKAAEIAQVRDLFAMVLIGLHPEDEADLFLRGTKERKGLATLDEWKASLAAGHSDTVAINRVVKRAGGRVNDVPNNAKGISAPASLKFVYDLGGPDLLRWTLETIREAFGDLDPPHVSANMIKGLAAFLAMYADLIDQEKLVGQLRKSGMGDIGRKSNAYREVSGHMGRTRLSSVYYALLDIYNSRHGGKRLPDRRFDKRDMTFAVIQHG